MSKEDQFISILKANDSVIYKIVRAYIDGRAYQKDLYQEIVYQLWKSFDSFRGDAKVSTWIYRIALNTCISYLQKGKRKPVTISLEFEHHYISEVNASSQLEEQMQILYGYIKKMNLIDKGVILLYLEGNTYEEIGEIMGFSTSRVGTRLSRIKDKLKTQVNN